ncbi:hypothetical protein WICPIJ_004921 [Wickerhamomyces pijperi]|uniref:Protein ECM3 n=1 Tax=Wickerhamomyces pijperi TaxID=599730 RepID=A0A9P8Q504_WICPI|nr:hypothetical protein WICPIJ_004921 [Wickerhamomyces pijperi]
MNESLSLGQAIYLAVKPIMKVYLVMFVGFMSVKLDLMSMETSRGISNTLVNLILPCLTFNKIVKNLSGSKIKLIGVIIMSGIVIFGVGGLLAFLLGLVLPGIPKKWRYGFIFAGIFCNISDLPIAYVQSLGSGIVFKLDEVDEGCTISVIFLVVQQLLLMNCGVFQVVGLDFRDYEGDDEKEVETVGSSGSSVSTEAKAVGTSSSSDLSATEKSNLKNSFDSTKSNNNNTAIARAQLSRTNTNMSHESFYSTRSAARMAHHPQDRETVINEYSEAGALRQQHNNIEELARTISLRQEIGLNRDAIDEVIETDEGGVIVIEHKHEPSKFDLFFERHKLGWLKYLIVNFKRIPSIVVLIALTIAMIPWIRCLFVKNSIHIKEAPDHQPVLSVIMDFTDYVGQAAIPLGVILLGGMIARLNVGAFNWKFLFSACCFTAMRLVLMPVLGVLYVKGLAKSNLISTNIEKFVLILSCSVPSATAQVYFTAFYTPLIGDHVQMDCLAVLLMIQYPVLLLSLPTVMTYVLKVHLGL